MWSSISKPIWLINWHEWLDTAKFLYNNQEHSTIGQSQFLLNYGYHHWIREPDLKEGVNDSATAFVTKLIKIRREAQALIILAGFQVKAIYNQ